VLHVTVHPKRFAERLKAVAGFAPRHSSFRPLETVLFSVAEDGSAMLRARNLESEVLCTVALASMVEPGAVLLVTDKVLKAIGDGKGPPIRIQETALDKVPMSSDANIPTRRVVVATSRIEVAFLTYRPEDFPDLVEQTPAQSVELPAWRFDRLIERTQFATDPDSTRYALAGCAFEFEPTDEPAGSEIGQLSLIATDGRRLARAYAPASGTGLDPLTHVGDDPSQSLAPAVPSVALKRLRSVIATLDHNNHPVRLGWTDAAQLQVVTQGLIFSARQVSGRFPSWRAIVPPPSPHRTTITDGPRLKRALKEAKGLLPKGHRCVRLRLVRNVLFIEVDVEDISSSTQVLTLRRDMPPEEEEILISFDPDYLLDWLAVMNGFELVFPIGPKQPALLRADGVDYYVMPLDTAEPEARKAEANPTEDDEEASQEDESEADPEDGREAKRA
jgi:DNA polymerase-3 subunit beta